MCVGLLRNKLAIRRIRVVFAEILDGTLFAEDVFYFDLLLGLFDAVLLLLLSRSILVVHAHLIFLGTAAVAAAAATAADAGDQEDGQD